MRTPGSPTADERRVGAVLDGRYRIERLLGRGRLGPVYQGERLGIERRVAIRIVLPQRFVSPDDLARRMGDAGFLDHPSCVAVSDHGTTDDGHTFVVTDLVTGTRLGDEIARAGRIPAHRALPIIRHLLRGLRHAHARGLIHGDVTTNDVILVDRDGDPDFARLLGFGLIKPVVVPDGDRLAAMGPVFGTPWYMAPEQALGKLVDVRTDLYAVTIVLYEMLTGAPPFAGADVVEVLRQQVTGVVPALSPAVAPEVEAIVLRGLAKDPAERPPSASAYLAAIDECLAQLGERDQATTQRLPPSRRSPTSDTTVRRPVDPPRRRPWRRRALGLVALATAAAATALIVTETVPLPSLARSRETETVATAHATPPTAHATPPTAHATSPTAHATPPAARSTPPAAARPAPPPWQASLDAALELAHRRRFDAAEDALRELMAAYPAEATLRLELGNVYLARNWPEPALKAYRAAIARDPALRTSPALITAVLSLLDSNSRWWDAARFLVDLGEPAIPALLAAAETDHSGIIRRRSRDVLERLGR